MKEADVRANAFAMPLTSPAFIGLGGGTFGDALAQEMCLASDLSSFLMKLASFDCSAFRTALYCVPVNGGDISYLR